MGEYTDYEITGDGIEDTLFFRVYHNGRANQLVDGSGTPQSFLDRPPLEIMAIWKIIKTLSTND